MQGRIYISGAFKEITLPKKKSDSRDNCPHFWTSPPTWGICRPDIRKVANVGDYIFFVLPSCARVPQMIYAYLNISEKIDHITAYYHPALESKRMGNKNPNGNIIVKANGDYNPFDSKKHLANFDKIKQHYVIGNPEKSEFLTEEKIRQKQPHFQDILNSTFQMNCQRPFDVISRNGRKMNEQQVQGLINWLK